MRKSVAIGSLFERDGLLDVAAAIALLIDARDAEVVVRKFLLGLLVERVEELFLHGGSARKDPQVLHIVLAARVNHRVGVVVCVHHQVVGLVEFLAKEGNDALAVGLAGAGGASVNASAGQEANRARVVDLEGSSLGIKIGVLGLRAVEVVRLESGAVRVLNFVPDAHVPGGVEGLSERLDGVARDFVGGASSCEGQN
eukprot:CAMPEP_0170457516 /NCGR_PEP_ID=MMETSP0123-20130129/4783_1 /TAXON_ID=182087 /ORGANISM="Favella ehrenbergii, Strain Fehren 1" /LENGTH=197 /DNA_ID=CAMNT_0010721337 /DNA_START=50 /DNA_END=644 /DNA_ORIENTATION=-